MKEPLNPVVAKMMAESELRCQAEMPDYVKQSLAGWLARKAREWINSEEGKKELTRRKVNQQHREEYAKRKNKDSD